MIKPNPDADSPILHRILRVKTKEVAKAKQTIPPENMRTKAESAASTVPFGPPRGFLRQLSRRDGVRIIAEVKRKSPSKGPLAPGIDGPKLAEAYARGGAAAISVLTDEPFFGGRGEDLQRVRATVSLPVLRKDFIIDEYQVDEARVWGADGVLLIVAALEDNQLRRLLTRIRDLGMDALVEVHTERELERALTAGARLVGVNNRDLRTFHTTLDVSLRLARHMPRDVTWVSESGIRSRDDVLMLAEAGARAVLIGESFVRSPNPERAVADLAHIPPSNGTTAPRVEEGMHR